MGYPPTDQGIPIKPTEEIPLTYSFTSRLALIRRVQNRANQMYDGNRSKMIVELLERGLEADSMSPSVHEGT